MDMLSENQAVIETIAEIGLRNEPDFDAGLDNLLRSLHENDTATRGGDGTAAPGHSSFCKKSNSHVATS